MALYLLGTLFLIVCVLLILVVLLQKGRGGGLGAAFGGAGSSAFGTRVGDVFTWVTIVLTALFLILALVTTVVFRPKPDQVGAPVFNVQPEDVEDWPVPIQMGSSTREAQIYYTLDGSEPTEESTLYEGAPVQIESGTTLKARGYRAGGWTPSEITEVYYGPEAATPPAEDAAESMGEIIDDATDTAADVADEAADTVEEAVDVATDMADEAAAEEAPAEEMPVEVPAQ